MAKTSKSPKVGNSDIGTSGNPGRPGRTSSKGVQYPFMPNEDSYSNAGLGSGTEQGGPTANTSKHIYPELPTSYPNGMGGGKGKK